MERDGKDRLYQALKPIVEAYREQSEPVGDSDLYNEQPRSVSATLGDWRRAERAVRDYEYHNRRVEPQSILEAAGFKVSETTPDGTVIMEPPDGFWK